MKEYTKEKLEDMTTDEVVELFMDLLREGHFEDALEETKKDGEAKTNRYNDGLYDVLNMVEDWWKQQYSDRSKSK